MTRFREGLLLALGLAVGLVIVSKWLERSLSALVLSPGGIVVAVLLFRALGRRSLR
jgi:putative effector of murein hydrolase LrgA (UPF0299 family)